MARSSISECSIEEQKSFLPYKDPEESLLCQYCSNRAQPSPGLFARWLPWSLNFCLTLALVFVIAIPTPHRFNASAHFDRFDILSPAKDSVEHIQYKFVSGFDPHISPYQGFPSEEKDKLWSELYAYGMTLAISDEEQSLLPDPGEKFPIKGHEHEYVVGLDVFHELHCLNHLRMAFYPRHYNMSMVKPDGSLDQSRWMHVDHCIESLRQSLICNADVSVVNFKWHDSSKIMEPVMENTHQCRNFSKIQEFAKERWVRLPHKRLHVETGGHIADYSGHANPEDIPLEKLFPGFNHTVGDL